MGKVLEAVNVNMDFGGIRALDRVSLEVEEHEIVALIGPNGAGKTTLFNCITGVYNPTHGDIWITPPGRHRHKINGLAPHFITHKGLARTFQNIRLFPSMTALENVMIGRHTRLEADILEAVVRGRNTIDEEKEVIRASYEILEKIGIEKYANEVAKNLPYGSQRKLEIARALATEPFLLLLDEPAAGMNPYETKELDALIIRIRETENLSIFIIEHDMSLVMSISDTVYVVDYGELIARGKPAEIRNDPAVIKAYLGEDVDAPAR
jgi:branched-chain amino acid transport system ATP-binding protein